MELFFSALERLCMLLPLRACPVILGCWKQRQTRTWAYIFLCRKGETIDFSPRFSGRFRTWWFLGLAQLASFGNYFILFHWLYFVYMWLSVSWQLCISMVSSLHMPIGGSQLPWISWGLMHLGQCLDRLGPTNDLETRLTGFFYGLHTGLSWFVYRVFFVFPT